jgi:hypothetical protein
MKLVRVAALGIPVILLFSFIMKPLRGPTKQPVLAGVDITIVIQSSRKDKSTKIVLDRSFLGLNERLYQKNNAIVVTDSLSAYLLLPDMNPAREYYDRPVSLSQMEQNEVILAEGNLVDVNLEQGTQTPASFSAMMKSLSWIKGSDSDSVPGFELFHVSAYIKSGIQESHVGLVPSDPEYRDRVYIDCPVNNTNTEIRQLCTCHTGFANQLFGSFSFSKSKFDEWKAIHQKVSAWVENKIAK